MFSKFLKENENVDPKLIKNDESVKKKISFDEKTPHFTFVHDDDDLKSHGSQEDHGDSFENKKPEKPKKAGTQEKKKDLSQENFYLYLFIILSCFLIIIGLYMISNEMNLIEQLKMKIVSPDHRTQNLRLEDYFFFFISGSFFFILFSVFKSIMISENLKYNLVLCGVTFLVFLFTVVFLDMKSDVRLYTHQEETSSSLFMDYLLGTPVLKLGLFFFLGFFLTKYVHGFDYSMIIFSFIFIFFTLVLFLCVLIDYYYVHDTLKFCENYFSFDLDYVNNWLISMILLFIGIMIILGVFMGTLQNYFYN